MVATVVIRVMALPHAMAEVAVDARVVMGTIVAAVVAVAPVVAVVMGITVAVATVATVAVARPTIAAELRLATIVPQLVPIAHLLPRLAVLVLLLSLAVLVLPPKKAKLLPLKKLHQLLQQQPKPASIALALFAKATLPLCLGWQA